jgi:hypothetical protein
VAPSTGEITSLLAAIRSGDPSAEANLVVLVYDEFRALARGQARLVEMLYFGGLTDWSAARAWLQAQPRAEPA